MARLFTRFSLTSFKGRLYLLVVVSALSLGVFAATAIYNIRDVSERLSAVYERQVDPLAALHEMEGALKDVRFRLAGYLLDQLPAVGNRNHLEEARDVIFESWKRFKDKTANNDFGDLERELIAQIDLHLGNVDEMFEKLARGYQQDDRQTLTVILEDEWPFAIHAPLLKPVSRLATLQQASVVTIYEKSVEQGRLRITLEVVVLGIMTLGLAAFAARLATRLARRLDKAAEVANRVAAGDWSENINETSRDEVGTLLRAIGNMRDQVHSRQERLQAVLDHSAEGLVVIDDRGIVEGFNPAAARLFGYAPEEIVGRNVSMLMPSPHREEHDGYIERYCRTGERHVLDGEREVIAMRKDGSTFPISIKVTEMHVAGRRRFLGMMADISERKTMLEQLQAREQRLRVVLDNTAEGIVTFDQQGVIESFNKAAKRLFGLDEKEMIGASISRLIATESVDRRENYLEHFLRNEIQQLVGHEGEITGRHKDGAVFPMSIKISTMDLEGKTLYIALVADISERKAVVERLKNMAEHDGLTGLYNRSYFQEVVERVVERVKRTGESDCALLYIDLDNFKYVNDTLGHATGDRLLVEVARMLARRARKSDLVARFGGDEFCILLSGTNADQAVIVAESFRKMLADHTLVAERQRVDVGCSIGIAMLSAKTRNSADAVSHADLACHLAKRGGRNRVYLFTPADEENITAMAVDMGWSRRIKEAIEKGKFLLACQPIVHIASHKTTSYEVLVRLRDDNDEIIMPAGFLPSAERFGLSLDIDRWVIAHAMKTLVQHRLTEPTIRYSINLSPQTMSSPIIGDIIRQALDDTGLDPSALVFEVTENAAISDMTVAARLLTQLRGYGCGTALDDFGSGMSSFAYLQELPVDYVKLDGRFVKNLAASTVDQAMVRAMNDIAHVLGKQTIAEYVENEASLKLLVEFGVDYAQGYYLGRPDTAFPCEVLAERAGNPVLCQIGSN